MDWCNWARWIRLQQPLVGSRRLARVVSTRCEVAAMPCGRLGITIMRYVENPKSCQRLATWWPTHCGRAWSPRLQTIHFGMQVGCEQTAGSIAASAAPTRSGASSAASAFVGAAEAAMLWLSLASAIAPSGAPTKSRASSVVGAAEAAMLWLQWASAIAPSGSPKKSAASAKRLSFCGSGGSRDAVALIGKCNRAFRRSHKIKSILGCGSGGSRDAVALTGKCNLSFRLCHKISSLSQEP